MNLSKRAAAEALGALLLVGVVIGSGILADAFSPDDGVALLGNTLATAAILFVLITMFGPISGAHFNPAVSLAFALRGELSWGACVLYIAAQCAGAVAGACLAHAMFELPLLQASTHARTGFGIGLSEAVATFALMFTILGVRRAQPALVPAAVALVITAGYWWTPSTSFANPAVTLARTFTDTFSGVRMADAPLFVAAEIAGAVAAVLIGAYFFGEKAEPA